MAPGESNGMAPAGHLASTILAGCRSCGQRGFRHFDIALDGSYGPAGIARGKDIGRKVACNHASGAHNGVPADAHPSEDNYVGGYPNISFQDDWPGNYSPEIADVVGGGDDHVAKRKTDILV